MKKLIILFLGLAVISCGGSDDDESMGRTTDPLIGTWRASADDGSITIVANANGTYSVSLIISGQSNNSITGTWTNSGNDFSQLTQNYVMLENGDDPEDADNVTFTFSADYNSMTDSEDPDTTFVRQ